MSKNNTYDQIARNLWRSRRRLAALMNGLFFHGDRVIQSCDIRFYDSVKTTVAKSLDGMVGIDRVGDLINFVCINRRYVLVGIENQQEIDDMMILRVLMYNTLDYQNQYRADRNEVYPVFPIVIYYGEKEWKAPQKLSELVREIPEELREEFNDWKYQLIDAKKVEAKEFPDQQVRDFFQGMKDLYCMKRNEEVEMKELDYEIAVSLAILSRSEEMIQYYRKEEGGKVNMCEALSSYVNSFKEEEFENGKEVGKEEGIQMEKENNVKRMLNLQYSYESIQEITGMNVKDIKKIELTLA